MHVRCDNQYKTGAGRGNILGQPMLFECMGICVLSPAHGYLVYVLIVKYLSHRFCLNSATVYQTERPYRGIFWEILKHFQKGLWTMSFKGIIQRIGSFSFTVVWPVRDALFKNVSINHHSLLQFRCFSWQIVYIIITMISRLHSDSDRFSLGRQKVNLSPLETAKLGDRVQHSPTFLP